MRGGGRTPDKPRAAHDNCGNRQNAEHHEDILHTAARSHAHAIDDRQRSDDDDGCDFLGASGEYELKIFGERDHHGRGATRVNHKQCHPAIKKSNRRMIGLAQVGVLAAYPRHAIRKFRVDKRTHERDCASRNPRGKNQRRRMNNFSDDIGIDKDSRAYDAAHHDHRGVK